MMAVDWDIAVPVTITLGGAWLWHGCTEHHWLLKWLRVVRPSTVIPETSHESRWHRTSHPKRLLVNAMLVLAAVLTGLAWELSPGVAITLILLVAMTAVTLGIIRFMAGRVGSQHASGPPEGGSS